MFTGLIERMGTLISLEGSSKGGKHLKVDVGDDYDANLGDSIAINGCCLTVVSMEGSVYGFDLSDETLSKTAFHSLDQNNPLNLERALRLGDRLGGHMVQGHVDETAKVARVTPGEITEVLLRVNCTSARYLIPKGSITVDGVSLTVNTLEDFDDRSEVGLTLIPETLARTNLARAKEGTVVNIEFDLIGKYIERIQEAR